mgnify:CR=1 FL=1
MASLFPVISAWYLDTTEDQVFEVVAVDEQYGTVEIQYIDGEVSEFDLETWSQLKLIPAEAPEDAGAAYELSHDDEWGFDHSIASANWSNPTINIEAESYPSIEDF